MVRNNKETVVKGSTETTAVDKVSLCVVITTIVIILIIVVTGVCVRFLLDEEVSRIILIAFICFLVVLGIVSLGYLEMRRRAAAKNRKVVVRNGQYYNIQPSAPQDTSWEYSNRATMPA
ncbi:uncharacterized protein LOC108915030 [Anoplophora glabripennis]|uniref:uncharacterized protein LOC108915030 n=1 Tax=Anoplophora glabripennis TaxID=217634 RepID=UPI000874219A|nr:uncharacterized protein LOC108915030 [Anoplophora glabripennis]